MEIRTFGAPGNCLSCVTLLGETSDTFWSAEATGAQPDSATAAVRADRSRRRPSEVPAEVAVSVSRPDTIFVMSLVL